MGFSFPDEATKEVEGLVRQEGRPASAVIVDALSEYFNGPAESPPTVPQDSDPPEETPPPVPSPQAPPTSAPAPDPRIDSIMAWMQSADQRLVSFEEQLAEGMKLLSEMKKDIGDLDERQGRLWHEVHDKAGADGKV